jgi:hypothetical protein
MRGIIPPFPHTSKNWDIASSLAIDITVVTFILHAYLNSHIEIPT